MDIPLTSIKVSEFNARKDLGAGTEDGGLDDLANSIHEKGLLNPIIVKRNSDSTFNLIAGQRRFLACKKLGWESIPAIIRDISDDTDATVISLIENIHRADMNPIDKARAYQKINEKYRDLNKVVKETGVSLATVKKYLALLDLAPSIQDRLSTSEGPAGIGTLSKVAEKFSPDEQEGVLDMIGGFKQNIQLEILRRSGGDIDRLSDLRQQAVEGAFDTHTCRSIDDCQFIPREMIEPLKEVIRQYETKDDIQFSDVIRRLKRI